MIDRTSTRRSDEQLWLILYETANWAVTGTRGVVLCEVASLRCAVEKAAEFGALGHRVVGLVRRARPETVVFSAQFQRLIGKCIEPLDWPVALHAMNA